MCQATENVPDVRVPSNETQTPTPVTPSPLTTTTPTQPPTPSPSSQMAPSLQPTPAPPGIPGVSAPHNPAQLMQNYLLNLFLQQACVPGMTGLPPSSLAQLLTGQAGFNFPFLPAQQTPAATNTVPPLTPTTTTQPSQTSLTSPHNPVKPVVSTAPAKKTCQTNSSSTHCQTSLSPPDTSEKTPPTDHAPKKAGMEEEGEEEKVSSLPKMKIKK